MTENTCRSRSVMSGVDRLGNTTSRSTVVVGQRALWACMNKRATFAAISHRVVQNLHMKRHSASLYLTYSEHRRRAACHCHATHVHRSRAHSPPSSADANVSIARAQHNRLMSDQVRVVTSRRPRLLGAPSSLAAGAGGRRAVCTKASCTCGIILKSLWLNAIQDPMCAFLESDLPLRGAHAAACDV